MFDSAEFSMGLLTEWASPMVRDPKHRKLEAFVFPTHPSMQRFQRSNICVNSIVSFTLSLRSKSNICSHQFHSYLLSASLFWAPRPSTFLPHWLALSRLYSILHILQAKHFSGLLYWLPYSSLCPLKTLEFLLHWCLPFLLFLSEDLSYFYVFTLV